MYNLPYFTEENQDTVIAFMKQNPFAIVTGNGNEYPVASHLPMNFEKRGEKIFLTGHMMKNTDHHKGFHANGHVLVIFSGPHCFVNADWYKKPDVGSTWNYMTVHAKGKMTFTDEEGTYNAVKAITNKYVGDGKEASFDKLPEEYISKLLKAIQGFEIEVISIDNVFKLSQNHDEGDRENIIHHLRQAGNANALEIAAEMERRILQAK